MKKSLRIISSLFMAAASLGTVLGAQAQDNMSAARKSYIGLNVGQSDFSLGSGTGLFASESRDTAYSIYAGTYFNYNLGLEFGYTDFGRVNRGGGSTRADGLGLSLVGKLPLGDAFNLLGKVGTTYGRTNVSSQPGSGIAAGDESGFGLSYGVGAEYAFNPQWSAVLQYDAQDLNFIGGSRERLSITTLGLRYRF